MAWLGSQRLAVAVPLLFVLGARSEGQMERLNGPLLASFDGDVRDWIVIPGGEAVLLSTPFRSFEGVFRLAADGSSPPVDLGPLVTLGFAATPTQVWLAPDGSRLVLRVRSFDDTEHLHVLPTDWIQPSIELGPVAQFEQRIEELQIAPDSTRAVYSIEYATGAVKIFSAPLDGSASAVELSATPQSGGNVSSDFEVSPDSSWVVYRAQLSLSGGSELFRVPIAGPRGLAVRLHPPLPTGRSTSLPRISPDSARVAYVSDASSDDVFELFSVPLDLGSGPIALQGSLVPGGDVATSVEISPDSTRVVYAADALVDEVTELFSVPLDGSAAPVRLSGPLVASGDVFPTHVRIAPDSSRVVYLADQLTDGVLELFSVPMDGGASPVLLSGAPAPIGFWLDFGIAPDSSHVVYRAEVTAGVTELFGAPLGGGAHWRLNATLPAGGDVDTFTVTPDSAHVVYLADQEVDELRVLFRASIDGGAMPVSLAPACQAGDTSSYHFDVADGRVLYAAYVESDSHAELVSAPLDGGAPIVLTDAPPLVTILGDVDAFAVSARGRDAVYSASQQDACSGSALYAVDLAGLPAPIDLTASTTGPVLRGLTPDGSRAVFTAVAPPGLYSARTDGSTGAVLLSSRVLRVEIPSSHALTPDGSTVVFLGEAAPLEHELLAVAVDGSAPERVLSGPLVANGDVAGFVLDPLGELVAYRADQAVDGVTELFAVALDGSGPPRRLNRPLVAGGDVEGAEFTPDGRRVVYLADQTTDGKTELYSVAARATPRVRERGGPLPSVKLNGALPAGGDVKAFRVSPDGARVAYVADQNVLGRFELFGAPSDAGRSAIRLSAPLVMGGDVFPWFLISSDGGHVVYVADQLVDDVFELFAVPLDGSAPPIRLNGPLVAGGDVATSPLGFARFAIASDGARVVYLADQTQDGVVELFSVPLDASQPAVRLNGALTNASGVLDFRIDPRGDRVAYVAFERQPLELFLAPIDGSARARALNAPVVAGRGVTSFAFAGDGQVLYRLDAAADDRFELFRTLVPRRAP